MNLDQTQCTQRQSSRAQSVSKRDVLQTSAADELGGRENAGARVAASRVRRVCRWGHLPVAAVLVGLLVFPPTIVRASIFGEENATLAGILGEDIAAVAQAVKTVSEIATEISQLQNIYRQGVTVLTGLKDPQGVANLLNYVQGTLSTLSRIDGDVKLLRYKLEQIDGDRQNVFPNLAQVPSGDYQAKARTWNASLRESSMVAMRAQTSIATLQQRMDRASQLTTDSNGAQGVVGQLQIVVRALALLHADLTAVETNLSTGQRVTATIAGIQAAETDRVDQTHQRMLENYTTMGSSPALLTELP